MTLLEIVSHGLAEGRRILERFLERFFPQLLTPVQPLNTESSTWAVYYNFDQYLWSPAGQSDRHARRL